ncbi:hypothetical protein VNO77_21494 [Canavalia gladiata]|uniref:Uncharacterized protein n=1 Tax=Canavalia gladiata TaxID=3824 RepID=A0AAN9LS43_CANGL
MVISKPQLGLAMSHHRLFSNLTPSPTPWHSQFHIKGHILYNSMLIHFTKIPSKPQSSFIFLTLPTVGNVVMPKNIHENPQRERSAQKAHTQKEERERERKGKK